MALVWNEEELEYQETPIPEDEIAKYIEEGLAIENMTSHLGWKVISESLKVSIEDIKSRLLHERDLDKIRRFQETARAYASVFDFIEHRIDDAKALSKKQDPSQDG